MSGMQVNFNNLRKQAVYACDSLTEKLNRAIIKTNDEFAKPNGYDWSVNLKGYVLIDAEDIQKQMDTLRQMIGSIAMTYEPNDEDFKDVYEEIFPENEDKRMACFNEEEEELA